MSGGGPGEDLGRLPGSYIESTKKGINGRRSVFQAPIDFLFSSALNPIPTDEQINAEPFEYKIRSARSWQSHSFTLLPGTYCILADVESENMEVVRYGLKVGREGEKSERPWLEARDLEQVDATRSRNGTNAVWMQFTSTGNFEVRIATEELCPGNFDTAAVVEALVVDIRRINRSLEASSISLNSKMSELKAAEEIKDVRVLRAQIHIDMVEALKSDIASLQQEVSELDAALTEKKSAWSSEKYAWMDVKQDTWPLMAETQEEAASRSLAAMVQDMRKEAVGIGARLKAMLPERDKRSRASSRSSVRSNGSFRK